MIVNPNVNSHKRQLTLIGFTLSNTRRFYLSMGNPLGVKGFKHKCTYILLTKREGHTGRISARGLDSTDQAQRGPYKKDRGPIFSQYGPRAWLIRYIYYTTWAVRGPITKIYLTAPSGAS